MKRLLLLLLLSACSRHITLVAPPTLDGSDASDDPARACAILAARGCPVGSDPHCADAIRLDQAQGVASQIDLPCILDGGTCGVTCK